MDIGGWLRGLGLERYEQAFRENEIDLRVLPELTADDLKELGVVAIGHRRLLLKAIADLAAGAGRGAAEDVPAAIPVNATPEAERRQLTVMFCDLVGSTELSSRLDPEDLREVIAAYHRSVTGVVTGYDGFVAKYMGDGVLVGMGRDIRRDNRCRRRALRQGIPSDRSGQPRHKAPSVIGPAMSSGRPSDWFVTGRSSGSKVPEPPKYRSHPGASGVKSAR